MKTLVKIACFIVLLWVACRKLPSTPSIEQAVVSSLSVTVGDVAPAETTTIKIKGPTAMTIFRDTLYVCNSLANNVLKISPTGELKILAGNGLPGNRPQAGEASVSGEDASFIALSGIAADLSGNIYVSDYGNGCIRQITPAGRVSTYAGIPGQLLYGEDNFKLLTTLFYPVGLTIDNTQAVPVLYTVVNDYLPTGNGLALAGEVKRITGGARGAILNFVTVPPLPSNVSIDLYGICLNPVDRKLYITQRSQNSIFVTSAVSVNSGIATVYSGAGNAGYTNGPLPIYSAPAGITSDPLGNLYIADARNNAVRKLVTGTSSQQGNASTVAGNSIAAPGDYIDSPQPLSARFKDPRGIALDSKGTLYLSDYLNNAIRKVSSDGQVTTLAQTPLPEPANIKPAGSPFAWTAPSGISVAGDGKLYVSDVGTNALYAIGPDGSVTTLGGPLSGNESGFIDAKAGAGYLARFNRPVDLICDLSGNVYIADAGNNCIRMYNAATRAITVFAGSNQGIAGYQDGSGSSALFNRPQGLAIGPNGDLFVSDAGNFRVRKIITRGLDSGKVATVAGSNKGFLDASNTASARFSELRGIAVDANNTLYVCDLGNQAIRRISSAGVSTLAGGASAGYKDGESQVALFNAPVGITAGGSGEVYVSDAVNHRIRKIGADGKVTTLAGSISGFADGSNTSAQFNYPQGIAYDAASKTVVVADQDNKQIRKISFR